MRHVLRAVVLALLLSVPAAAAGPVQFTFNAPVDRAWDRTMAVLKVLGWDIDRSDQSIGIIVTGSRRLDGDNFGVYEKALRHRLQLNLRRATDTRTTISIERSVFKRERILFVDKDEPITDPRTDTEKSILDAIGKAL
ncbi:MAG: hypothetical protein DMD78_21395 [Candidatus Rokuibacteriota bacterium]|nr:MAG: hypothetical protein DMD78_21395 [Candidatus Rokubacteria bacterium]